MASSVKVAGSGIEEDPVARLMAGPVLALASKVTGVTEPSGFRTS
jgi:hypothetical protein